MKAFDNIEKDIILKGDVTEEGVAAFRRLLESHLDELSPLRTSKEKTEKYFKQHLWPGAIGGDSPDFKEIRLYTFEDVDGKEAAAYVQRNDLIASLKKVLQDDQISCSYIYNLLTYGCNYADSKTHRVNLKEAREHYRPLADIQYAIEFDLEKIKVLAEEPKTTEGKIKQLQHYLKVSREYEGVSQDVKGQVEFSIELLIENLQKELDIFEKAKMSLLPDSGESEKQRPAPLLFYNFWGDRMYEYQLRAAKLTLRTREQNSVLFQPSNSDMLVAKIVPLFRTLKKPASEKTDMDFAKTVEMLGQMMMDFSRRIYHAAKGDFSVLFAEGKAWMAETRKCIARAYSESLAIQEDYPKSTWKDTYRYKNQLQQWCGGAFMVEMISPAICPHSELKNTILYNFWGDTYKQTREELLQKFILTDEEEDMVDFASNAQYFGNRFDLLYATSSTRASDPRLNRTDLESFTKMVTGQANDFIVRLRETGNTSEPFLRFATDMWLWLTRFFTDLTIDQDMDRMYLHINASGTQAAKDDKLFIAQMAFRSRLCETLERSFKRIAAGFDRFIAASCKQSDSADIPAAAETATKAAPVTKKAEPAEPPLSENITYSKDLTREQQEALHAFLHEKMDTEKNYHGYAALYAAIDLKYLRKPTFPQVSKEFDIPISKEQNYSSFMGKNGKFQPANRAHEHRDLISDLKDEIKALPAFNTK